VTFGEYGTIEEQRLAETLHRLTPEPPRHVTVEDIAIRLANRNAPARGVPRGVVSGGGAVRDGGLGGFGGGFGGFGGGGRPRRGRLAPLLAAASVVAVVGTSVGVAVTLSSHTSATPATSGGTLRAGSQLPGTRAPATTTVMPYVTGNAPSPTAPPPRTTPITNGAWGAGIDVPTALTAGSLVAGGSHLYGFTTDDLLEIDPTTNTTVHEVSYNGFPDQAPVIADGKVWVVASYGGGVTLAAYDEQTLASAGTVNVPSSGGTLAGEPDGVLAAGPNGDLYVADGPLVDEVDPASGSVVQHYAVNGSANAVAVSPDGSTLYVGSLGGAQFRITEYDVASGHQLATGTGQASVGGDMVATPGGVWFTTGLAMAERVWFAPAGDLAARLIAGAGNGGQDSVPTYADGAIWVGGAQRLQCLDPATGQVRASSYIPSDNGIQSDIGDIAVLGGRVYADYLDNQTNSGGVALLTPPSACFASTSPGPGSGS
jgi:hypothetical protein